MINKIKYWWFRRNNDHPCAAEIKELTARTRLKSLTILGVCAHFCMTESLEETAIEFEVTRERVRQILWKLYWSVHRVESDIRSAS